MTLEPTRQIAAQLSLAEAAIERHLGNTLAAIHLYGSAVDGGLKPDSDIDLLVTLQEAPQEAVRQALMTDLLDVSAAPASAASLRPLEVTVITREAVVPWRYPPRRELQFGEWLRETLQAGIFEEPMHDHDLAVILTKVRQHSVSLVGPDAADLFDPVPPADLVRALKDTVAQWNGPDDWTGDERNIVLTLARIWYTAVTGHIASKDAAANWLLDRLDEPHRELLIDARDAYLGKIKGRLTDTHDVRSFVQHARTAIARLCD